MQDTISNREIANIDMSKIAALQQKRTLAFVNHFVVTTVQFLNNFAKKCEQKLMHFERKLEKINAAMVLLEARLSSIPEVNAPQKDPKSEENKNDFNSNEQEKDNDKTTEPSKAIATDELETTTGATIAKPEYERFIKMVQVGVPIDAVKLKISLEGLDPREFDNIMRK
ncbi:WASH complex subunit 3 [Maniola hyperantus]|uniref:WASH complex subunit 3 n=1 Tax=Aphantopus hyperantus TaxID=2795564 RepID=UPI001568AC16|nr:WASH complex subunit 3 [Maniola hyperantus]